MSNETILKCARRITPTAPQRENLEEQKELKTQLEELKQKKCKTKWIFNFTFCPCPICSSFVGNKFKDKDSGKDTIKIPFTDLHIPMITNIFDMTKGYYAMLRSGKTCGVCKGSRKAPNASDDKKNYEEAHKKLKENQSRITALEKQIPDGGSDTTIVLGNSTLIVGGATNAAKAAKILPDTQPVLNINNTTTAPMPSGVLASNVSGVQTKLGWNSGIGTYTVSCGNAYNLFAGSGGIQAITTGPLKIQGNGLVSISGPSVTIGCRQGPLVLEGDSVSIGGKHITMAPTSGNVNYKGSLSSSGNLTIQGHLHAESISFVNGAATMTRKHTSENSGNGADPVTKTGSKSGFASATAGTGLSTFIQGLFANWETAFSKILSPEMLDQYASKIAQLGKTALFIEPIPGGIVLPGLTIGMVTLPPTILISPGGSYPVISVPHPIHVFPHNHGTPQQSHWHTIEVPDIKTYADPKSLRAASLSPQQYSGAPADPISDPLGRILRKLKVAYDFFANLGKSITHKVTEKTADSST